MYQTLIDPSAIEHWRVPPGMRCHVHEFDARVGGRFRVSLTYDEPGAAGKSNEHTDTYHGHFAELVPNERIVETLEFETEDPAFQGTMRVTTTLTDSQGGTDLVGVHEGLPAGIRPEDNEYGWKMSLEKLAALLEGPSVGR